LNRVFPNKDQAKVRCPPTIGFDMIIINNVGKTTTNCPMFDGLYHPSKMGGMVTLGMVYGIVSTTIFPPKNKSLFV
jgi:hypothetical protein